VGEVLGFKLGINSNVPVAQLFLNATEIEFSIPYCEHRYWLQLGVNYGKCDTYMEARPFMLKGSKLLGTK